MNCTKCGHKMRCKQTYYSPHNEIIRIRKCEFCNHSIYTLEFEVDYDAKLADDILEARRRTRLFYSQMKNRRTNNE